MTNTTSEKYSALISKYYIAFLCSAIILGIVFLYVLLPVYGMSAVWSVPYFSGAANTQWGGEWLFAPIDVQNLGLFFSFFAFAIIIFYSYIRLFGNLAFWGDVLPGWTSTIIIVSFFSGLILFSLGIIAEYIWRIYEEVKDRPGYIIKKK